MMHKGTKWFPWCFFLVIGLLIHKSFAATNSTFIEPSNSTTDGKNAATATNGSGNTSFPPPSGNNTSNLTSPYPLLTSNTNTSSSPTGNNTSNSTSLEPPESSNTNTSSSPAGNNTSNSTSLKPPESSNTNTSSSLTGNATGESATGSGRTPEVSGTAPIGTGTTSAGAGVSANGSESASKGNGTVSENAGATLTGTETSLTAGSGTTPAVTGTAPTGSGAASTRSDASTAGSGSASSGSATASAGAEAGSTSTGTGSTGTVTGSTGMGTGLINSTYNSTTLAKPAVQAISLKFTSMEYSDALCTKGTSLFNQFAAQVKAGIDAMGFKSMPNSYVSNSSAMYACYQGSVIANTTFSTTTSSGAQILADNIVAAGPNGTFTNLTVDVTSVQVAVAPNITQNSKNNLANEKPVEIENTFIPDRAVINPPYLTLVTLPSLLGLLFVVMVFMVATAGRDACLCRICNNNQAKEKSAP